MTWLWWCLLAVLFVGCVLMTLALCQVAADADRVIDEFHRRGR